MKRRIKIIQAFTRAATVKSAGGWYAKIRPPTNGSAAAEAAV